MFEYNFLRFKSIFSFYGIIIFMIESEKINKIVILNLNFVFKDKKMTKMLL
jgi:hypothetical protein